MIEITMVSGAKYFMKMEMKTRETNVGVMNRYMAGGHGASVEVYSDDNFTENVFINPLKIESYRLIV